MGGVKERKADAAAAGNEPRQLAKVMVLLISLPTVVGAELCRGAENTDGGARILASGGVVCTSIGHSLVDLGGILEVPGN